MNVDQALVPAFPDSMKKPSGTWPNRAELDTFLFAVGGVRWRMTQPVNGLQPLSPPGIFKGYRYDTLGTRHGQANPTIPLSLIGRYSHVVWMVDAVGATWEPGIVGEPPSGSVQPQTTLRYMSDPNRQNTLATWVGQGGQLWGLGGGFGTATNGPWDKRGNNANAVLTFSTVQPNADLGPGRFTFDICHWRSEWRFYGPINAQIARLDQPDPNPQLPTGGRNWPGEPFQNPNVDYSSLPLRMLPKDPITDPIWPWRTPVDFYVNNTRYSTSGIDIEYITLENRITETRPVPGHPVATYEVSTLDTLYNAYGPKYPARMLQPGEGVNAVMTYYHGGDNAPVLFTGFDIWHYRRQDCLGLVNFVLGQLWGLPRTTLFAARASAPAATNRSGISSFQRPAQRPARGATWPTLTTQPRRGSLNGSRHE
jgi:hypothetical protein